MKLRTEPFHPARTWDHRTCEAYADQPLRSGRHFRLDEDCSPAEVDAWRAWCVRWGKPYWPGHVLDYIERKKWREGQQLGHAP